MLNQNLVGKYINYRGYSDVEPVGKIIALKGKSSVVVQVVVAGENLAKMEWVSGGFSGHCVNQSEQRYEFTETAETKVIRLSKAFLKCHNISEAPRKYYDYNF